MDDTRFCQFPVAVPTSRLSRRMLTQTSVGLAAGAFAVGPLSRVADAQEADATPATPEPTPQRKSLWPPNASAP